MIYWRVVNYLGVQFVYEQAKRPDAYIIFLFMRLVHSGEEATFSTRAAAKQNKKTL